MTKRKNTFEKKSLNRVLLGQPGFAGFLFISVFYLTRTSLATGQTGSRVDRVTVNRVLPGFCLSSSFALLEPVRPPGRPAVPGRSEFNNHAPSSIAHHCCFLDFYYSNIYMNSAFFPFIFYNFILSYIYFNLIHLTYTKCHKLKMNQKLIFQNQV